MPLNDRQIKNAKPAAKPYKLADGGGLYLAVTPAGGKSWRLKYRIGGKEKLLTIGKYPAVSLLEARQAAEQARADLAKGADPAAAKQQAKAARQAAACNTFENIAREWHAYQLPGWTPAHAAKVWRSFEADILPAIGKEPIHTISVKQIQAVIDHVAARGALDTAATVLQRIKAVFNYAIRTERAENNLAVPLVGIIKAPKQKHQPALPQSELTEFYRRLMRENIKQPTRLAMLLIMLTFVRAGELRKAEWADFDFEAREWRIPADKDEDESPAHRAAGRLDAGTAARAARPYRPQPLSVSRRRQPRQAHERKHTKLPHRPHGIQRHCHPARFPQLGNRRIERKRLPARRDRTAACPC